jgi:hypothetical protein
VNSPGCDSGVEGTGAAATGAGAGGEGCDAGGAGAGDGAGSAAKDANIRVKSPGSEATGGAGGGGVPGAAIIWPVGIGCASRNMPANAPVSAGGGAAGGAGGGGAVGIFHTPARVSFRSSIAACSWSLSHSDKCWKGGAAVTTN